MRKVTLIAVFFLLVGASVATAGRRQTRYVGIHPIAKAEGGGLCHIESPHVHVYGPTNKVEYRDHHGSNYFVGDPVAYGYDGPRHSYKGHHPIHVEATVGGDGETLEFCYLDGPHYHYFAPPEGPEFRFVGNTYFYVAEPPPVYIEQRPAYVKVNAIYTPIVYTRPVVEVEPPMGWIGVRVGYGVVAPAAVVVPPAVVVPAPRVRVGAEVHIPAPSLNVNIGIGARPVVVREHHHVKVKHKKYKRSRGWRGR